MDVIITAESVEDHVAAAISDHAIETEIEDDSATEVT